MKRSICINSVFLSGMLCFGMPGCDDENQIGDDGTKNVSDETEALKLYTDSVLKLKEEFADDPERLGAAVEELRSLHHLNLTEEIPSSTLPAPYKKATISSSADLPVSSVASTQAFSPRALSYKADIDRNEITYDVRAPFIVEYTVPANASMTTYATAKNGSDPVAILYRCTAHCNWYEVGELDVLAFGDDYNGKLDSYVYWKNNTGSAVSVYSLVFPYGEWASGTVDINIQVNGQGYAYNNAPLVGKRAVPRYSNPFRPGGCGEAWGSDPCPNHRYAEFQPDDPQIFATDDWECATSNQNDTWLWVFNLNTMKGLTNDDNGYGNHASKIEHDAILPEMPWYSTSIVLLGGYEDGGSAVFIQADPYRCTD